MRQMRMESPGPQKSSSTDRHLKAMPPVANRSRFRFQEVPLDVRGKL